MTNLATSNGAWFLAVCPLMIALTLGCGGSGGEKPGEGGKATESSGLKKVSAAKLPALGDYLPALDGGKVEIAPPKGWKILSRDNKYLTRMVLGSEIGLPRILVTVEESNWEGAGSTTGANVVEHAGLVAADLKERKIEPVEPPKPMQIGENAFVRYVLKSKMGPKIIERQMLQTVSGVRLYTIDLQVPKDEIVKHRDEAYAVAAGMKFTPSAPAGEAPPSDAAPATP